MSLNSIRVNLYRDINKNFISSGQTVTEFKPDLESRNLLRECAFVCDHLTRLVGKVDTGKCRIINILCGNNVQQVRMINLVNSIDVEMPFDYDNYKCMSVHEKQNAIINLLDSMVNHVCKSQKWDHSKFQLAIDKIKQANFVNNYDFGKKVFNSSKDEAHFWLEHDLHEMRIFITVKRKNRNKVLIPVKRALQSEFDYFRYLGTITWIDEDHLQLENADGKTSFQL